MSKKDPFEEVRRGHKKAMKTLAALEEDLKEIRRRLAEPITLRTLH